MFRGFRRRLGRIEVCIYSGYSYTWKFAKSKHQHRSLSLRTNLQRRAHTISTMRLTVAVALAALMSVSLGNPSIICILNIVTAPRHLLGPFQLTKLSSSLLLLSASLSIGIYPSHSWFVAKTKTKPHKKDLKRNRQTPVHQFTAERVVPRGKPSLHLESVAKTKSSRQPKSRRKN